MNLGGKDVGGKAKTNRKPPAPKQPAKKGKAAKAKPVRKRKVEPDLDLEDEVVLPHSQEEEESAEQLEEQAPVQPVKAFEGGYVHPAFSNAMNAHWRKSSETTIFLSALNLGPRIDGAFFGAIYVKSSFMRKTGGSALL